MIANMYLDRQFRNRKKNYLLYKKISFAADFNGRSGGRRKKK